MRYLKGHRSLWAFILSLTLVCVSQTGWSITIVAGPNAGSNPITDINYSSAGPNYSLPLTQVAQDNSGPYWIKNLRATGIDQGPSRPVLTVGQSLTLLERIEVSGANGWSDWHEVFSSDGWSWTAGNIYYAGTLTPIAGLSTTISAAGTGDNHFDNIDFVFDALAAGTQIDIVKTFRFEGLDVTFGTGNWGSDDIVIRQWPTNPIPEPATLSLLGLGVGLMAFMRRRRVVA